VVLQLAGRNRGNRGDGVLAGMAVTLEVDPDECPRCARPR
jgi:hypothetical protein